MAMVRVPVFDADDDILKCSLSSLREAGKISEVHDTIPITVNTVCSSLYYKPFYCILL